MFCPFIEFGAVCPFQITPVTGKFYNRTLQSQSNSKKGDLVFSGDPCSENLAFDPPVTEPAGD